MKVLHGIKFSEQEDYNTPKCRLYSVEEAYIKILKNGLEERIKAKKALVELTKQVVSEHENSTISAA
jgi:hypothetical protein